MVEVAGYFCCACRELWQDEQQAMKKHCASAKHRRNYEVRDQLTFCVPLR